MFALGAAAMVSSSPLCLEKRRSCKCTHRFLLIFASTSIFLLLSSIFWSQLSLSNCPWHHFTEKLTQFHRDYSGDSGFQYIDSTFVPRGRMRALSFVGYSKNERKQYVIPLKLSVGFREQHRQLDKRWEEKLARFWEESDDVDAIGKFEDTGMGYGAGEMDIDENWQTESENEEIDNNDTFYEAVPLEVPGELEEEISVSIERTELIINNPDVGSDGISTSDEGGRGAVVDDEDYEDEVEMDEEGNFSGSSVDESAAITDDAKCETCDVSSEATGVSEDFREAELAWKWTRGSGVIGEMSSFSVWRGWWQVVFNSIYDSLSSPHKWFMVGVESEGPPAQLLMWMGRQVELGAVVM